MLIFSSLNVGVGGATGSPFFQYHSLLLHGRNCLSAALSLELAIRDRYFASDWEVIQSFQKEESTGKNSVGNLIKNTAVVAGRRRMLARFHHLIGQKYICNWELSTVIPECV